MKAFHFLFVALFILAACQSGPAEEQQPETTTKGSLFIIGGGSRPEAMVQRMIVEAGVDKEGYVVILPMSSSAPDSAIIWSGAQFLKQGLVNVTGFNFPSGEEPNEIWVDSLRNARLIYISGGDQNRFMTIVKDTPIMEAIHHAYENGALIAGTSAGAAVMSEKMITGNELKYPDYQSTFRTIEAENIELAQGLGLISTAIIDQHFVWRSRHNRLLTAVIEHPALVGIGIDESTAILVKGDSAEVVGISQVIVYRNPNQSTRNLSGKLGAEALQVDVMLPGDKFRIR
ncbi:MAG: cyanophycinase [Bacteroidales bacterium]|nr:cyanophycinase [Bacteroidales bacterium]